MQRRDPSLLTALRAAVLVGVASALSAKPASALEPDSAAPASPSVLARLSAGRDLLQRVPAIAELEGGWSIVMQLDTLLTSRRWDAPYPKGLIAQQATRVLYGTTWTAMIALESLTLSLASGGRFDWLAEAHYRTDWMFGVSAPSCPTPGANAGCGVGIGGFGGIEVRPFKSSLWYEVSGGWLEQRIASDSRRTLEESAWVLTPLTVTYAASASAGPLGIDARLGPGAYFGMHSAHLHPTTAGERTLDVPWHELYPLDGGVGPGARAELGVTFAHVVRLEGGVVAAPLVLGSRRTHVAPELEPLRLEPNGVPWWRALSCGVAVSDPAWPMRLGMSFFAAELSTRRIEALGHAGFMLRFDFPLRAPGARSATGRHARD